MVVVSVPLSHRKVGSCEEDIGFLKTAGLCGLCRLPQWLHTKRTRRLSVMSSNWVWSYGRTSIQPCCSRGTIFLGCQLSGQGSLLSDVEQLLPVQIQCSDDALIGKTSKCGVGRLRLCDVT